jgi:hypothetical protein
MPRKRFKLMRFGPLAVRLRILTRHGMQLARPVHAVETDVWYTLPLTDPSGLQVCAPMWVFKVEVARED